jgi:NADH-quinone oxidoreductase subunit L
VSAYSAGMFHLMTHAFFKALLFLAAGSVIIGMHHEQDMRKMGGLFKYMRITAITSWIGALSLIGTPFFSGFYSNDTIIEAVHASHRWGANYAYWCVLLGVFVTALYTFRMIFMTFHGPERFRHPEQVQDEPAGASHDAHGHDDHGPIEPHESPWVVTGPLIALAIPSILIGMLSAGAILFGGYFGDSIRVLERNDVLQELGREFNGPWQMALQGFASLPFWLAAAGVLTAWAFFLWRPQWADAAARTFAPIRKLLINKYYFDWFNENVLAALARGLGFTFWKAGDEVLIDGVMVNGSAAAVGWFGSIVRRVQNGYLYAYAFWMVIGLAALLGWFLVR